METEIIKIKFDIKNLYKIVDSQKKDTESLFKLASSIEMLVKETEYLREDIREIKDKDIKEIKDENKYIKYELENHVTTNLKKNSDEFDCYKKEITKWVIFLILGVFFGILVKGGA